jgi:hypothetical protein
MISANVVSGRRPATFGRDHGLDSTLDGPTAGHFLSYLQRMQSTTWNAGGAPVGDAGSVNGPDDSRRSNVVESGGAHHHHHHHYAQQATGVVDGTSAGQWVGGANRQGAGEAGYQEAENADAHRTQDCDGRDETGGQALNALNEISDTQTPLQNAEDIDQAVEQMLEGSGRQNGSQQPQLIQTLQNIADQVAQAQGLSSTVKNESLGEIGQILNQIAQGRGGIAAAGSKSADGDGINGANGNGQRANCASAASPTAFGGSAMSSNALSYA